MNDTRAYSKQIFILDASVMIKLIAQEDGIDSPLEKSIQKLTKDITQKKIGIISTPLLCWEVGNWAGRAFPGQALEIISSLPVFGIQEHRLNLEVSSETFSIMRRCPRVTFYDASYHGLAMSTGGIFITNDVAYYREAHHLGRITLLQDY